MNHNIYETHNKYSFPKFTINKFIQMDEFTRRIHKPTTYGVFSVVKMNFNHLFRNF